MPALDRQGVIDFPKDSRVTREKSGLGGIVWKQQLRAQDSFLNAGNIFFFERRQWQKTGSGHPCLVDESGRAYGRTFHQQRNELFDDELFGHPGFKTGAIIGLKRMIKSRRQRDETDPKSWGFHGIQ
ncbi:MAG: hypothetical protein ACYDH0_08145, partial [Candidatus Aminicenantales bacterium]